MCVYVCKYVWKAVLRCAVLCCVVLLESTAGTNLLPPSGCANLLSKAVSPWKCQSQAVIPCVRYQSHSPGDVKSRCQLGQLEAPHRLVQ